MGRESHKGMRFRVASSLEMKLMLIKPRQFGICGNEIFGYAHFSVLMSQNCHCVPSLVIREESKTETKKEATMRVLSSTISISRVIPKKPLNVLDPKQNREIF